MFIKTQKNKEEILSIIDTAITTQDRGKLATLPKSNY
jgi:hypothetical protein